MNLDELPTVEFAFPGPLRDQLCAPGAGVAAYGRCPYPRRLRADSGRPVGTPGRGRALWPSGAGPTHQRKPRRSGLCILRPALPRYRCELLDIAQLARPLMPLHLQPRRLASTSQPAALPLPSQPVSYWPASSLKRAS